ncbi:MAG TPA: hypothetical protein VL968_10570, partial [Rhodocyclaceae bacterium]|nr:hypothetical protein [Rhodocyclaceae bacterium]
FTTAWMGENHFAAGPAALYGFVLLMAAVAYALLQQAIVCIDGQGSLLKTALGQDWKGKLSPVLYLLAIGATFLHPWIAGGIYVLVALLWLVPDRRIEKALAAKESPPAP